MNTAMQTPAAPTANAFERTFRELRHGRVATEASEELAHLIEAVEKTGRGGEITIKLKVKPASAGDTVTVQIDDDITVKLPRMPRGSSIFFIGEGFALQRTDPRQREFEITTVKTAPATPAPAPTPARAASA